MRMILWMSYIELMRRENSIQINVFQISEKIRIFLRVKVFACRLPSSPRVEYCVSGSEEEEEK